MLTTHERIRIESGYQHRFERRPFLTNPNSGTSTEFFVKTDDVVKIVPNLSTGNTVAGVSDVQVWLGLSGVLGVSRMGISSVDAERGVVILNTPASSGSSLTITFASSPLSYNDIEDVRLQAESMVNQRLSLCYNLPIAPLPSMITSLATRLSAALLLIRDYGVGSRSTSKDGYQLYAKIVGDHEVAYSDSGKGTVNVGELGMICTPGYQIVDDTGVIVPRNDDSNVSTGVGYTNGGRNPGRVFDVSEENWRFKQPQSDADANQPGTPASIPPYLPRF
jgi:hypothetical protein